MQATENTVSVRRSVGLTLNPANTLMLEKTRAIKVE